MRLPSRAMTAPDGLDLREGNDRNVLVIRLEDGLVGEMPIV